MKEVVIATNNQGKAKEFEALLHSKGYTIKTLKDFPDVPEIIENGETFEENALIKARTLSGIVHTMVLADDSGLKVDVLDGEPGIYSARYAGVGATDQENNEKLLMNLKGVPLTQRTAQFHCTLALVDPEKEDLVVEGEVEGVILEAPKGTNGFGYDPLFYVPSEGKTMAELSNEEKNHLSHRAVALSKLENQWDEWMQHD